MNNWVYHPIQKPLLVSDAEYPIYLENGWFKTYADIPGYVANEHGENINESDEYAAQIICENPEIKKRGRPKKTKNSEVPTFKLNGETHEHTVQ